MKKIIVTLCSLALSIAGTLGANQMASNNEAITDKNIEQVYIEQDAETMEAKAALPANKDTAEESTEKQEKASEVEVAAPKAEKTERKETANTKAEKNTTVTNKDKKNNKTDNSVKTSVENKADTKKTTADTSNEKAVINTAVNQKADSNAVKKNDTVTNAANSTTQNNTTQNNTNQSTTEQKKILDYINNFKSNGNNILVYKNVDLSDCESTQDVVEELQKNGYKNININNIQNISSLQDILSLICDQNPASKPEPTTPPAPTTAPKPNPTTSPAPTTAPKPTATPKPAPTSTPTDSSGSNQGYADEVLRLVNIERSKAGLSSLSTNATLKAAADKRAQETVTSFSHTRPNGSKFSTVLQEYGISYRTAGENIAYGQRSPQEVVNGWMNSPGHRANILNGSFNKIGIGVYQSRGVIYWSQLFTN